jgi:hypothetical protein
MQILRVERSHRGRTPTGLRALRPGISQSKTPGAVAAGRAAGREEENVEQGLLPDYVNKFYI